MIYQDYKFRAISWFLFPLLAILLIIRGVLIINFLNYIKIISINILFLLIQFSLVYIYFRIKSIKFMELFKKVIGPGDILFITIASFAFSFVNFIIYQVLTLFIILSIFLLLKLLSVQFKKFIPLAGAMAISLIMFIFTHDIIHKIDLFDNQFLIYLIYG